MLPFIVAAAVISVASIGAAYWYIGIYSKKFTSKYRIIEEIGKGCFSVVHKVQQKSDNKMFAAKEINLSTNKHIVEREILALEKVTKVTKVTKVHENIVSLIEVFKETNPIVLVLDYCDNGTLNMRILYQEIPLDTQKKYMRDIFSGLEILHRLQILHLDLKPDNILFKGDILKLSDFGLAKTYSERNKVRSLYCYERCGDISMPRFYTAPEFELVKDRRITGRGLSTDITYKADIFQAALVFLAMQLRTRIPTTPDREELGANRECIYLAAPFVRNVSGCPRPIAVAIVDQMGNVLEEVFNKIEDREMLQMIRQMADVDPGKRPSARGLMNRMDVSLGRRSDAPGGTGVRRRQVLEMDCGSV